jgi:hypothetical protein
MGKPFKGGTSAGLAEEQKPDQRSSWFSRPLFRRLTLLRKE